VAAATGELPRFQSTIGKQHDRAQIHATASDFIECGVDVGAFNVMSRARRNSSLMTLTSLLRVSKRQGAHFFDGFLPLMTRFAVHHMPRVVMLREASHNTATVGCKLVPTIRCISGFHSVDETSAAMKSGG